MAGSSRDDARVCVGQIVAAHGIRGLVKLKSFTEDPAAVAAYGPLTDESGRRTFAIHLQSAAGTALIASIDGIRDRNAAEALRGTRLYVERDRLPEAEEDEFYHADLIGLPAELPDGQPFGHVVAIHDFGAGDMLELKLVAGGTVMVPFTRQAVPVVDPKGGRIVIDPPPGLLEEPERDGPEHDGPEEER